MVVAPLVVSAGTNVKVLEAMACGKALVTTPVGCAGLGLVDRQDALIRGDWGQFAEAVIALVANNELRKSIAFQARRTAEARFDWSRVSVSAHESHLQLARKAGPRLHTGDSLHSATNLRVSAQTAP